MIIKRLWQILNMCLIGGGKARGDYARRKNIYAYVGKNVSIQSRMVPLYSELIKLHDNVHIARNVDFCTHDIINVALNGCKSYDNIFKEQIGCIEIMDNCFIGSNSVILYGVKIGPNVIVASGSLVNKDCEPNSVYAGVPARKVGTFDNYVKRRIEAEHNDKIAVTTHNQHLTQEEIAKAWEVFDRKHI